MIYDEGRRRNWGIASSRGLSNMSNWASLNIKFRYGWMMLYGVHDVELLCKFNNTFTFHGSCILIKFKDLDGNCCSWKFSFYVSIFRRFKEFLFGCFISKLGVLGNFNFSSFLLGFSLIKTCNGSFLFSRRWSLCLNMHSSNKLTKFWFGFEFSNFSGIQESLIRDYWLVLGNQNSFKYVWLGVRSSYIFCVLFRIWGTSTLGE